MKPLIGVTPLFDEEKSSPWMQPAYLNAIQKAGGLPIVLPLEMEKEDICLLVEKLDGFLFTGGHDISPALYDETPLPACERVIPERDELERKLFEAAFPKEKPLLGICRGSQILNVLLGGTLYQDIPTQYDTPLNHRQKPPHNIPCHGLKVFKNTLLHQITKQDTLQVNSIHHQAIQQPAPVLQIEALSEDGLIEATSHPAHPFFLAVQWHPERMFENDPVQLKLFEAFVRACKMKS